MSEFYYFTNYCITLLVILVEYSCRNEIVFVQFHYCELVVVRYLHLR